MRLTPRKDEIAEVVALLESDGYDSAEALAKDIIKAAAEMLWNRDWLALTHHWQEGERGLNWGPFSSEAEAKSVAEKIGAGGRYGVVKLFSPGVLLARAVGNSKIKSMCQDERCGHAPWLHHMDGNARGACGLTMCGCKRFTK